jgi:hypothetical protein
MMAPQLGPIPAKGVTFPLTPRRGYRIAVYFAALNGVDSFYVFSTRIIYKRFGRLLSVNIFNREYPMKV